jgi:hypothetical protein
MNYKLIQEKLRNGTSIQEVCRQHHITFKKLCDTLKSYERTMTARETRTQHTPVQYILERDNIYSVRKTVKGKTRIFGTYHTLEDAIQVRDALILDGWHQTHVDSICKRLGVNRRKGYINEKVRYHE